MKKLPFLALPLAATLLLVGCGLFVTTREIDTAGTLVMENRAHPAEEAEPSAPALQMANPWKSYDSHAEAAQAAGCARALPETVGGYRAETFRVMNGALLELTYRQEDSEGILRWSAEEETDISGVYSGFETAVIADRADGSYTIYHGENGEELMLVFLAGRGSYSVHAPAGFADGAGDAFCEAVLQS